MEKVRVESSRFYTQNQIFKNFKYEKTDFKAWLQTSNSPILGTPRRKKKIVHQTVASDDKKLQSTLKKLAVNNIPGAFSVFLILT